MKSNLIGFSGKSKSGKDTVAKIFQILSIFPEMSTEKVVEEIVKGKEFANQKYEVRKFADKLKEIVALLIGCKREDLENQEFKDQVLPEEWWVLKFGENTILPYNSETYVGAIHEKFLIKTTGRLLLQLIGTDCMRNIVHPNIWLLSLFSEYKEGHSKWMITDVRFPNEKEAIEKRGGINIRVERPSLVIPEGEHFSERALDEDFRTWDEVIVNDGDLKDLVEKCKSILKNN